MSGGSPAPAFDAPHFLQLVGHPLRWALLAELARSDRTVHELVGAIDQPQNLVSYHLGKLRTGGLVSTRRSSADRRDAYYAVDLATFRDRLAEVGALLHPGLRRAAAPDRPPASASVLFLCTGNSARSQMAEALVRERSGGRVEACSAGSHPKPVHPNAVRVMRETCGIDIAGRRSTHLDVFADRRFDRVITLCDRVREVCPDFPGVPVRSHWSLPDPAASGSDDDTTYPAFQELAAQLEARIEFLLADLAARPTAA